MNNKIAPQTIDSLVNQALVVRSRAHAPYSRFHVGAALLTSTGESFAGCNVENASFSLTLCAERVAAATAVAGGNTRWLAIAVASLGGATPCGACRQFLAEFGHDLLVITVDVQSKQVKRFQLSTLLPYAFDQTALPDAALRNLDTKI